MPRCLPSLGLVVVAGLVAGACLASPATPGPITPGTPDAPRPVTVIMRDYLFEPIPLRLVRGETVRFTIVNAGLLSHDFVLGDATVQSAWASAEAAATPPGFLATPPPASVPPGTGGLRIWLTSGQTATATYTVPAAGDLELICQVPGHAAQGMVGVVTFVEPSPP
ncbi:MAG: hypothetical protein ACHQ15_03640 [Candidatus Limnocylindrales bacterium]